MRLYKQYVRPHLEFSTPAWSPWTEGDKKILEKVQQRAVAMVSRLKSTVYTERLQELGLETLEERRHQADMKMVHAIMHRRGNLDPNTWFETQNTHRNLRSTADPLNIRKKKGKTEIRNNFFSIRVVDHWNKIPQELKAVENHIRFKNNYKKLRANQLTRP